MHRSVLGVAVAVLLWPAGCAGPTDDVAPAPASVAGANPGIEAIAGALEVGVEYPRYLHTQRRVEITVTNTGETPVMILAVTLDAPQFASTGPVPKDTTIGPGRRVDLQTGYGAARCEVAPDSDASAILRIEDASGMSGDVVVALPPDTLSSIHDEECGQQAVRAVVDLRLSADVSVAAARLQTELIVTRRASAEPVRITGVRGSVIFNVAPVGEATTPPVTLAPDEEEAYVPLEVVAARCDPHAVADSKKTYLFALWVELGDEPEQFVTVDAEPVLRAPLDRLIDQCRAGNGGP